jgi:hypothetical protein
VICRRLKTQPAGCSSLRGVLESLFPYRNHTPTPGEPKAPDMQAEKRVRFPSLSAPAHAKGQLHSKRTGGPWVHNYQLSKPWLPYAWTCSSKTIIATRPVPRRKVHICGLVPSARVDRYGKKESNGSSPVANTLADSGHD